MKTLCSSFLTMAIRGFCQAGGVEQREDWQIVTDGGDLSSDFLKVPPLGAKHPQPGHS
jgi:hypothetical protein